MVRLKGTFSEVDSIFKRCFNSNMVRLKAVFRILFIFLIEFQFQYGTIKRLIPGQQASPVSMFQFQYGTIKS